MVTAPAPTVKAPSPYPSHDTSSTGAGTADCPDHCARADRIVGLLQLLRIGGPLSNEPLRASLLGLLLCAGEMRAVSCCQKQSKRCAQCQYSPKGQVGEGGYGALLCLRTDPSAAGVLYPVVIADAMVLCCLGGRVFSSGVGGGGGHRAPQNWKGKGLN